MSSTKNRFGIAELSDEHVQRLLQAASMISDGDSEVEDTILDGTTANLTKYIAEGDGSETAIEEAVDKAEGVMPDLAFGDADEVIDDAIDLLALEGDDNESDEFMGGNFESLDAIEEEELSGDKLSYEEFQEEWN